MREKKKKSSEKNTKFVGETLAFMLKTAAKEKPSLFFCYLGLFLAELAMNLKNILIPKFLIDELLLVINGAPVESHLHTIIVCALLLVGIDFVATGCKTIAESIKNTLGEWFNQYFAVMLAEHAMGMDYEHTENPQALDQLNKAKEGISWYSGGVVGILDYFYQIVLNATIFVSVAAIILVKCPLIFPVQIVALLFDSFYNAKINKKEEENFLKLAKINRMFGYVLYRLVSFEYGKDIRLYNSSGLMAQKADAYTEDTTNVWKDGAIAGEKNLLKMDVINCLRGGISYFYIGFLAVAKKITIGDFSMCISASASLYSSLNQMIDCGMEIRKRCNYAYQFLLFLEYPSAMQTGEKKVSGGEHVIEFSDVSFRYPRSEKYVLRHINLTIRSGEHLSIVGLNGAGKTTFIKLLCRLYAVTEGKIYIDGVDIMEYSEEEYRKLFAVVFQDFKLFAFTLRENITLGDSDFSEEEIARVLKLSGFDEDAGKLEKGLDTMIYKSFDEKGTELSGGQQQKVAISRALYRNAPIVILDEPTAALDPVAEYDIYRKFNSLVGGKTAIYISHRLSSCKFCDHIAVFAEDTIKEYGTHEELVHKKNGIYAQMFFTQAKHYIDIA